MPFPLAHPALVLPLRRFCPRWLSFPALVIGSISPDLSYLFARWGADGLAHRPLAGFLFSVPAGLVFLGGLYFASHLAVRLLPSWFGTAGGNPRAEFSFRGLFQGRRWQVSLMIILLSLLVGTASHVLWDSFTHKTGWLARGVPLLQAPLFSLFGRTIRPHHLLWYVSSFGGAACIAYAWQRWRERAPSVPELGTAQRVLRSILLSLILVPIAAVHHLFRGMPGNLVAGIMTVVFLLWILAMSRAPRPTDPLSTSAPIAR